MLLLKVTFFESDEDVEIEDYVIPKNMLVIVDIRKNHRKSGDDFDPGRWLNGNSVPGYYAFSSGTHSCFGRLLVMKTIRTVLKKCLKKRIECDMDVDTKIKVSILFILLILDDSSTKECTPISTLRSLNYQNSRLGNRIKIK